MCFIAVIEGSLFYIWDFTCLYLFGLNHYLVKHYFRIVLGLQKSGEDCPASSLKPHTHFLYCPYLTFIWLICYN